MITATHMHCTFGRKYVLIDFDLLKREWINTFVKPTWSHLKCLMFKFFLFILFLNKENEK